MEALEEDFQVEDLESIWMTCLIWDSAEEEEEDKVEAEGKAEVVEEHTLFRSEEEVDTPEDALEEEEDSVSISDNHIMLISVITLPFESIILYQFQKLKIISMFCCTLNPTHEG